MTDPLADLARLEGVPSAVAAALDAADAVLRDRGRRQVPAEVSAQALLAGAKASARIEGDEWLAGSVRLSTELIELAGAVRRTPAQVLARAHVLLARGVVEDDALGRTTTTETDRLAGLMGLLAGSTTASPLVLAAVAHAEVATLRPFGGGDGVLARAVEHLVLIEAGIDPRAALVPEAGHAAAGSAYSGGLQRYATGQAAGVRDWIVHCAQALTFGAESSPLGAARRFRKDGSV
ncbi:Fic family protein [Mariniluteicoccus flavus]